MGLRVVLLAIGASYDQIHDCLSAVRFCIGESGSGEEVSYADVGAEDLGLQEITALLKSIRLAGKNGIFIISFLKKRNLMINLKELKRKVTMQLDLFLWISMIQRKSW